MVRHLLLTAILLFPWQIQAALKTFVDRNPVALDQPFQLTIESDTGGAQPDISVLNKDFVILSQGTSSSFSFRNGKFSNKTSLIVTLQARQTGQFVIPALQSANGDRSKPIKITVKASPPPPTAAAGNPIFITLSTDRDEVYVQQQVLLKVQVFSSVQESPASNYSEPVIPGAIVEKIGKPYDYYKILNGKRYRVSEMSYAVFPQQSGKLSIPPIVYTAHIKQRANKSRSGPFSDPFFSDFDDLFGGNTRKQRVQSKAMEIRVKPQPSQAPTPWLPAQHLELTDEWSEYPPKFKVGEPITRTFKLRASGLTAAHLPDISEPEQSNFKTYPDQPELDNQQTATGIEGIKIQKQAIVPVKEGDFVLPAINIDWWNTTTDRKETASLPALKIKVMPQAAGLTNQQQEMTSPAQPQPSTQQRPEPAFTETPTRPNWWLWIAIFFAFIWLVTLLFLFYKPKRQPEQISPRPAPRTHTNNQWREDLKKACANNHPEQAKQALLDWAKTLPHSPTNLLTLAEQLNDDDLANELIELDRALYQKVSTNWEGANLWRLVAHYKLNNQDQLQSNDQLEQLYKIS